MPNPLSVTSALSIATQTIITKSELDDLTSTYSSDDILGPNVFSKPANKSDDVVLSGFGSDMLKTDMIDVLERENTTFELLRKTRKDVPKLNSPA